MKIKKREWKTQLITLSLVLTTFLSSFSVVRAAYAFSPQYFSFTHGAASVGTYIEEANTTTATSFDIATVVSANFDKYYTGTVTLKWTYNSSNYQQNITQWSIVVVGGKIDSVTSGTLVIRVYDQNSFQVIMHYYAGNLATIPSDDPGFNFTGATSSLSSVTNHNDEYDNIKSIDARIQGLNTNLVDLIGIANTCSGYLSDIGTYVDGVEGYLAKEYNGTYDSDVEQLLNTIKTQQQTTNSNLVGVSSAVTSLNSYLGTVIGSWNIQDPPMNIIQALNSIAGDMASIESELNNIYTQIQSINNNVSSINSLLNTMQQDLTNLLSTVQNIDNLIDSISWYQLRGDFGYSSSYDGEITPYPSSNVGDLYNTYLTFVTTLDASYISSMGSSILHLYYPIAVRGNNLSRVTLVTSAGVDITNQYEVVKFSSRLGFDIYIRSITENSTGYFGNSNIRINIFIPRAYFYGTSYKQPSAGVLSNNDIEYWQLISYFSQLKQYSIINDFDEDLMDKLNDVIDAINNIQVTVNVTEQEITNITNNFDTDIDTIHNIENNYKIDFDGWNNQLPSSDLSVDLSPYNSTLNFIKANITNLWTNPFVNLPIIVSCLCFVFMVILG